MAASQRNSLDLLRLVAAVMVLYSHQFVLMGQADPSFFGLTTFGGAGVTVFFFLSGWLVWSSWDRDPHLWRFFVRRSLRIFPALWVVVFFALFFMGPVLSSLSLPDYFAATETWRYAATAFLVPRYTLPGVFVDNAYARVVNGSLWTLPVEFLCYVSVAALGCLRAIPDNLRMAAMILLVVLLACFAPLVTGAKFTLYFEMLAAFWAGAFYGYACKKTDQTNPGQWLTWGAGLLALAAFALLGPRGVERSAMLLLAASLVMGAQRLTWGAALTDRWGDLSYGFYIWAFPVQQMVVHTGRVQGWGWGASFVGSLILTGGLAWLSWHLVEKPVLRFKPATRVAP